MKIRGFRIEANEVEAALLALDNIREAVVVKWEPARADDERLVAYIVVKQDTAPSIGELRSLLKQRLPDYMVPSAFVLLDTLPLLPNGKVDRQALPPPAVTRQNLETSFVAPRSPVEEILTGIWSEVLGLDQVGIHDNFLELGGHSLMATQIISRVIDRFRVELPVKSLLEAPTVAEMAVVIVQNQAKKAGEEELNRMLAELEALSDEEAQQLLYRIA